MLLSILVSFVVALTICLVSSRIWQRKIHNSQEIESITRRVRDEIDALITELNGTTERNVALLENRIQVLTEHIERAGKITKVLDRENEKNHNVERVYRELALNRPIATAPAGSDESPENSGEDESSEAQNKPSIVDFDSLPIREKALFLHRQGESMERITESLGMSRGEIELIISLHSRMS